MRLLLVALFSGCILDLKGQDSFFGNPHTFELRPRFSVTELHTPSTVESDADALIAVDGDLATTFGAGSWRLRPREDQYPRGESIAVCSNLSSGEIVVFDGAGATYTRDGVGFSRAQANDNEGDGDPAPRTLAAMSYDGTLSKTITVDGLAIGPRDTLYFAATPASANGSDYARIDSDFVETRVRLRNE